MERRTTRRTWAGGLGLGLMACLWSQPATAQGVPVPSGAQTGFRGFGTGSGPGAAASNSFANPYSNPYLNPLMTQQQMSPEQAALYFLAARQASGGVGSGRLGGPGASLPRGGDADEMIKRAGTANTPGARASSYFNRTNPTTVGANRYYNRQGRYFPENGR